MAAAQIEDLPFVHYEQSASPDRLQTILAHFNHRRLSPQAVGGGWRRDMLDDLNHRILEAKFLEQILGEVEAQAQAAPRDPDAFLAWFEALEVVGAGQRDPLFPWLAQEASLEEMAWFLTQEVAGEAGFEDLVAMTQVKLPQGPKLELARNFWDEMGRGDARGMHGPMLARLARALNLDPQISATTPEALALGNAMIGLAANRRFAFHSIGALGVIELTAPRRATQVAAGLKRLGVPAEDRHYFDVHAVLDVKHSAAWNQEVLLPLISADPAVAPAIAAGALVRLSLGAQCFARYREHFFGSGAPALQADAPSRAA